MIGTLLTAGVFFLGASAMLLFLAWKSTERERKQWEQWTKDSRYIAPKEEI